MPTTVFLLLRLQLGSAAKVALQKLLESSLN